jgi:hypothetical protein
VATPPPPSGYFLLSRKMFDGSDDFWAEKRVYSRAEAWIDLLAMASWRPRGQTVKGVVVNLQRGQILASLRFLGARWQWSKGKVERFLDNIAECKRVERRTDHPAGHLGPILTILNYETYQSGQADDGTVAGQSRDSRGTVKATKTAHSAGHVSGSATPYDSETYREASPSDGTHDGTAAGQCRNGNSPKPGQREVIEVKEKEREERTLFPVASGAGSRPKDEPLPALPPDLAAIPGMLEAWEARLQERRAKKSRGKQTAHQVEGLYKLLRRVVQARGPAHALFCVQRATGNGNQGVVFDTDLEARNGNGSSKGADIRRTAGAPGTDYGPGAFDPERGIVS